jgi:hypothetical protein
MQYRKVRGCRGDTSTRLHRQRVETNVEMNIPLNRLQNRHTATEVQLFLFGLSEGARRTYKSIKCKVK